MGRGKEKVGQGQGSGWVSKVLYRVVWLGLGGEGGAPGEPSPRTAAPSTGPPPPQAWPNYPAHPHPSTRPRGERGRR